MTPLQLKQLVAAGGIAGELAGMVIERDETAKVAAKCMKEMQDRIDRDQKFIDGVKDEMIEIKAGLEDASNERA